ncbi:MAG TPA: dUTP diphosphatase [Acidobacteriaceae bacterium]|jgi:dUTP pyrophosphatase|nr:dUTP diphosphatase [Acidobacteriaceae bacterium]
MFKVQLLHPNAKIPTVAHPGADIGFDLYSVEDIVLHPGVPTRVRTGIAVEGPPGWGFILGDRSSMAMRGVTYAGGRIDAGYRGELLICLLNVNQPVYNLKVDRGSNGEIKDVSLERTDVSIAIAKGDKIIQMSPFQAMTSEDIEIASELSAASRGAKGFGSSGR